MDAITQQDRMIMRYNDYQHIINVGAYAESDPDGNADGSLWCGDVNISEAIEKMEAKAHEQGLKFASTQPHKAGTKMVYVLVLLADNDNAEIASQGIEAEIRGLVNTLPKGCISAYKISHNENYRYSLLLTPHTLVFDDVTGDEAIRWTRNYVESRNKK